MFGAGQLYQIALGVAYLNTPYSHSRPISRPTKGDPGMILKIQRTPADHQPWYPYSVRADSYLSTGNTSSALRHGLGTRIHRYVLLVVAGPDLSTNTPARPRSHWCIRRSWLVLTLVPEPVLSLPAAQRGT